MENFMTRVFKASELYVGEVIELQEVGKDNKGNTSLKGKLIAPKAYLYIKENGEFIRVSTGEVIPELTEKSAIGNVGIVRPSTLNQYYNPEFKYLGIEELEMDLLQVTDLEKRFLENPDAYKVLGDFVEYYGEEKE